MARPPRWLSVGGSGLFAGSTQVFEEALLKIPESPELLVSRLLSLHDLLR